MSWLKLAPPADLIDDRAAVGAEGRRSEQWIDRGAREPARAAARRRGGDLTGEAAFAQIEFATDSSLERNGFELPVPRQIGNGFEASSKSKWG